MTGSDGGWLLRDPKQYDREYAVDPTELAVFLHATQPEIAAAVDIVDDTPTRRSFLARLQGEITRRGVIAGLRNGMNHGPHHIDLFYGTPSPDNQKAVERNAANRFVVSRQLRYSRDETKLALDL